MVCSLMFIRRHELFAEQVLVFFLQNASRAHFEAHIRVSYLCFVSHFIPHILPAAVQHKHHYTAWTCHCLHRTVQHSIPFPPSSLGLLGGTVLHAPKKLGVHHSTSWNFDLWTTTSHHQHQSKIDAHIVVSEFLVTFE